MSGSVVRPTFGYERFVVCDIALFYAPRSGGIRTYLDEKARFAAASRAYEHHLVVPGRRERHQGHRHELRSLQLAASNGYRLPLGIRALGETLRGIEPDVVIFHDPFWRPLSGTPEAHRLGAAVVAVHHASPALNAAGIPGPDAVYLPPLRRIYHHAYEHVDAVMSKVDPKPDTGRSASICIPSSDLVRRSGGSTCCTSVGCRSRNGSATCCARWPPRAGAAGCCWWGTGRRVA